MIDRYIIGDVDRISPEAPVQVVDVKKNDYLLGGSGNVAMNLKTLGADVTTIGAVGDDAARKKIQSILGKNKIKWRLVRSKKTTVKNRVVSSTGQQLIRYDNECKDKVLYNPKGLVEEDYDVIIITDYGKGFVTQGLMDALKEKNTPIIVDPYPPNSKLYEGVYMITPNKKEFREMDVPEVEYCAVTCGRNGIFLISPFDHGKQFFPSVQQQVYDVQGAGDTVVAVMGFMIGGGFKDIEFCVKVANECAGYVVSRRGTSVVPREFFCKAVTL